MIDFQTSCLNTVLKWAQRGKTWRFDDMCGDAGATVMAAVMAIEEPCAESVRKVSQDLWDNTMAYVKERHAKKMEVKTARYEHKTANRALYRALPHLTVGFKKGKDGRPRPNWKFTFGIATAGLLESIMVHENRVGAVPVVIPVHNDLPEDKDGRQIHPDSEEWEAFARENFRASKEKILWNMDVVGDWLYRMFPLGIDFTAYNHRLRSALIPDGFMAGHKVRCVPLMDNRAKEGQDIVPDNDVVSGADGSGVYDPDHPMFTTLMDRYGPCILQITVVHESTGTFCKGIVRPEQNACARYGTNETGLFLDHLQVKGARKAAHKAMKKAGVIHDYDDCYIGFMDARNRKQDYHANFEIMENVDHKAMGAAFVLADDEVFNPGERVEVKTNMGRKYNCTVLCTVTAADRRKVLLVKGDFPEKSLKCYLSAGSDTSVHVHTDEESGWEVRGLKTVHKVIKGKTIRVAQAIGRNLQREFLDNIMRGGVQRQLDRIANEDDEIKLLLEFDRQVQARYPEGKRPNILSLDMVRHAYEDRLQSDLWIAATGAGVGGNQATIIMDEAVPPGCVVHRDIKPGQEAAIWRFPTVLACGLVTLTGMIPLAQHVVGDDVVVNAIYMNPVDVLKMQGDDDGDIIGFSLDPRVTALFNLRIDSNFYAIEPDGKPLLGSDGKPLRSDSEEGRKYGQYDPMGAVGLFTIMRTQLLAVGDKWGALAMSVLVQESIDTAKRKVHYSNYKRAADPSAWQKKGDNYYLHYDGSNNLHANADLEEHELIEEVGEWVRQRLNAHGCIQAKKRGESQDPISWYRQKRVEVNPATGKEVVKKVKKRLVLKNLQYTGDKSNGYKGGNFVHILHDWTVSWWRAHEEQFALDNTEPTDMARFLPDLLKTMGTVIKPRKLTRDQYNVLAARIGLVDFGKEMKKAWEKSDPEEKNMEIKRAVSALHSQLASTCTLQDQVDVWFYHMTPTWQYKQDARDRDWIYTHDAKLVNEMKRKKGCGPWAVNKPQMAFRVATHPQSEILERLGVEVENECPFMERPSKRIPSQNIMTRTVHVAMGTDNAYATLSKLVHNDTSHARRITDENGVGIPMYECRCCTEKLQTALIRRIRNQTKTSLLDDMKKLTTKVNAFKRQTEYDPAGWIITRAEDRVTEHIDHHPEDFDLSTFG